MKKVTLCRHAKAEGLDLKGEDFDRQLTQRGKQQMTQIGRRCKKRLERPDLVLASSAKRALQTAAIYAKETGVKKKTIESRQDLYAATAADCLHALRSLPDEIGHILLIGHNPALAELAQQLINDFEASLPTSAVVSAHFDLASWKDLRTGQGRLTYFDHPDYGAELARPLQEFRSRLSAELMESIAKRLTDLDPDIANDVAPMVTRASTRIAKTFTRSMKKSRKYARLPRPAVTDALAAEKESSPKAADVLQEEAAPR